jgi:hypothetical protein
LFSKVSAIHAQIRLSLSLSLSLSPAVASALNTGKTSTLKRNLDRHFDSLNQIESAEELLAIAMFSSGTPLPLVANENWTTFKEKLLPSCKLPSWKTSTNVLKRPSKQNEYQRAEAPIKTKRVPT